jgi:hypothetical protein
MRQYTKPDPARFGRYQVVGKRNYRDHAPGDIFEARLMRQAEYRAIQRGDIVLLEEVLPQLVPGSYALPPGWLEEPTPRPPRRREASLSLGGM